MDLRGPDFHISLMRAQRERFRPARLTAGTAAPRWIVMHPVSSSSIAAAGYDPGSQTLRLRFVHGSAYDYQPVPAAIFQAFLAAPSKGRFVNWRIKPRYKCARLH